MNYEDSLRSLMIMALADGTIDDREMEELRKSSRRWGIGEDVFERILAEAESPDAPLRLPEGAEDRYQMLSDLAMIMAADGKITDLEREMFALAAARMEMTPKQIDDVLADVVDDDDLILGDE